MITNFPNQSISKGTLVYGPLAELKKNDNEQYYGDVIDRMLTKFNNGDYDDIEIDFSSFRKRLKFNTEQNHLFKLGRFRFILSQLEQLAKTKKFDNKTLTIKLIDFLDQTSNSFDSKLSLEYPMFDFFGPRFKPE